MVIGALLVGLFTVIDPHIRATVPDLRALLREGSERSPTFRSLVTRLNESDVVVYLEYDQSLGHDFRGFLTYVSSAGGRRYVQVRIDWQLPREHQLAILGHELQHAVEVSEAPDVVDEESLRRFYGKIGTHWNRGARRCYDTRAAVDAGRQVLREIRRREPRVGREVAAEGKHDRDAIASGASRHETRH